MNGLGVSAVLALAAALILQGTAPGWWPLSFLLVLQAAAFAGGNYAVGSFRRSDHAALPMVGLLHGDHDHVLDAGCGAGRTTIALRDMLARGRVTAVDLFDASYIQGGGGALLRRNLAITGMTAQVRAVKANLVRLPFANASFDSAVSTAVFAHLGSAKQPALDEVFRTLRPGGRFLVCVWVPSVTTFMVGSFFSFWLSSSCSGGAWPVVPASTLQPKA